MAVENLTATSRGDKALTEGVSTRYGLNEFISTVEVTAAASATSPYHIARLPSSVRLSGLSTISLDDLASTGAPTLDIGTFAIEGNVTDDDDAINDGIDAATAATGTAMIKTIDNYGKYLWEIAGESTDPGGMIDVKITLKDAATNTGGTIVTSLVYHVDGS